MAKENKTEGNEEKKEMKNVAAADAKKEKIEEKKEPLEKPRESKVATQEKKELKEENKEIKKEERALVKKDEAFARGLNLPVSKKQCMYICSFIKNKTIGQAMNDLNDVIKMKRAVPFKGEIPHRRGKMMSGRYPVKASMLFVNMLKSLKGNANVNGLDSEKTRIYLASASWAARPMRSNNRSAKRTYVILRAKEIKTLKGESQ